MSKTFYMEEKDIKLEDRYSELMNGFEERQFIVNEWPLENGVYRQYSALDSAGTSVSGTSLCL